MHKNSRLETNLKELSIISPQEKPREILDTKDSDSDGVPDWKESFSNDTPPSPQTESTNNNLTEKLGQDLFSQYMGMKKTSGINDAEVTTISSDLASKLLKQEEIGIYRDTDLSVINSNDSASIRLYGNALASIRSEYYAKNSSDNFVFSGFDDGTFAKKMSYTASLYEEMAKVIINLPVPASARNLHLALANNYSASGKNLDLFALIETDPARSVKGISTYATLQSEESEILRNIAVYLRQSGIIFSSDEPGSFWNTL